MHLLEWERNDCNITMLAVPTEGISFCICHFASKSEPLIPVCYKCRDAWGEAYSNILIRPKTT